MSLIEGDAFYPSLFPSSEIPIDFAVPSGLCDSPGFRQLKKFSTTDLSAPQTVPSVSSQQSDEPLFQLFMSGGIDKMEFPLNSTLLKGLQMTDDVLLLQSGLIHKNGEMVPGMDMKFNPSMLSDMGVVPDFAQGKMLMDEPKNGKQSKRKFPTPQQPGKMDVFQAPSPSGIDNLSPEDERNAKRQRRLVKNREAAQLFRQRQKAYIQDLEKRVTDLTTSNNEYRARVELLNSENKLIKEQLIYLRNFITQSPGPGSPNGAGPTMSPSTGGSPSSSMNGMPINLPPGLSLPPGMFGMNMPGMAMLSGMTPPGFAPPMSIPNNFPPMGMPPAGMMNPQNMNQPPMSQNMNQPPMSQNMNQPPMSQNMNQPPMPQSMQPHHNMQPPMNSQGNMIPNDPHPIPPPMNNMNQNSPSSPNQDIDDKSKIKLIK